MSFEIDRNEGELMSGFDNFDNTIFWKEALEVFC